MASTRSALVNALAFGLALVPLVRADTCSAIARSTNIEIDYPLSIAYLEEQTEYWSTAASELTPTCIFKPKSAEAVAAILAELHKNNEPFAVKSGGHNPNNYYSSVDDGPLISTANLNEVIYDSYSQTVRIGPGNRWEDVSRELDPLGRSVVGGRIGNVGVGGYMLGLGLGFHSAQYGWAASNIKAYEVVLANSTIVTASATRHPDLFNALKGGGSNYGVVTAYIVQTHPQGPVWGGTLTFTALQADEILAATRDFTENPPDDKAAIIVTAEAAAANIFSPFIVFLFYDGPKPPPGTFDSFLNIGPILNTAKTQSLDSLLRANDFFVLKGFRYNIGTETTTLPNLKNGPEVMRAFYDHFADIAYSIKETTGLLASMAFQPMSKTIVEKARAQGGDLLDLDPSVDRIILEFDLAHTFGIDDKKVDQAMQALYGGLRRLVRKFISEGKLPKGYLPLFMNDCYFRQNYFGRLRPEKGEFAAHVAELYDPNGFFRNRTGGFKIPENL